MTDAEEKVEKQGAQVDLPPGSIQVLEGSTFMLSDPRGDVDQGTVAGLYHEDTRHLNRFVLTVNGAAPTVLTSREIDYYSAVFFTTNPDLDGIPARSLTIATLGTRPRSRSDTPRHRAPRRGPRPPRSCGSGSPSGSTPGAAA
jgi:hypothetical protein